MKKILVLIGILLIMVVIHSLCIEQQISCIEVGDLMYVVSVSNDYYELKYYDIEGNTQYCAGGNIQEIVEYLGESGNICFVYGHVWEKSDMVYATNPPTYERKCKICGKVQTGIYKGIEWE